MKEMRSLTEEREHQVSSAKICQRPEKFIDKDMVLMKLMYLLWGGLVTTYVIYLNPFYVSIGIPKGKVGIITGIPYAVTVIAAPFWGIITDHSGYQRVILIVLCLCSAVWISSLPLIASAVGIKVETNKTNLSKSTTNETGFLCNNGVCGNMSQREPITNSLTNLDIQITNGDTMFYTFVIVMGLGSVFFSCVDGYIEAIAFKTMKASPKGATYGTQRVYGSLGACVNTYLTGVLLDHFTMKGMSPFAIIFFSYPIFPLLLIPMVLLLIKQQRKWMEACKSKSAKERFPNPLYVKKKKEEESIRKELRSLFCKIDTIMFMTTVLVAGLSFSMVFFLVFLINEKLDVSKSKISLAFSVESISNIIVFFGISRLIKLMRGPIPTIIFSLFCYCIRYVSMSYTKSYWVIVALQGLSGFSFGAIWCSFMEHVHEISPIKIKTTVIVLVQGVHYGLARFLGNAIGGVLYGMFDATHLVRWTGIMCGIWSCVLIVYYSIRHHVKQQGSVSTTPPVNQAMIQCDEAASLNQSDV